MNLKKQVRIFIKNLIFKIIVFPYSFFKFKPTVLMYHAVSNKNHYLSILPEEFEKQIVYLKNNGFKFLRSTDLESMVANNYEKQVLITFDDGLEDLYYHAVPILKKYNVPAIFFIPTGLVNEKFIRPEFNCLNWEQIKEISNNELFEIGSHAISHKKLTDLNIEEATDEVLKSKIILEEKIGRPVYSFAPPFGKYNKDILSAIKLAGYKYSFSTLPGHLSKSCNLLEIPRLGVDYFNSKYFKDVFKGGNVIFVNFCHLLFG